MIIRPIIQIDEEKCDGCGNCITACEEEAIKIVDGKAKLINEIYCDGLGACLGSCPKGAITIVERQALPFNSEATKQHLQLIKSKERPSCECLEVTKSHKLNNWPIKLKLIPVDANFLRNSDIIIAADCTAFSYRGFHEEVLKEKKLLIACPKLDNVNLYLEKLIDIFKLNNISSVSVLRMSVPCCAALSFIVQEAMKRANTKAKYEDRIIDIHGRLQIL